MYLLIQYPGGVVVEGIVLEKLRGRLRGGRSGIADAVELKRSGTNWFTTSKLPVELEFMMSCNFSERKTLARKNRALRTVHGAAV